MTKFNNDFFTLTCDYIKDELIGMKQYITVDVSTTKAIIDEVSTYLTLVTDNFFYHFFFSFLPPLNFIFHKLLFSDLFIHIYP